MMDTEAPKQARDKLPEHGHGEGVGAESLSAAHALLTPPPRAVPRRQKFWRKGWHLLHPRRPVQLLYADQAGGGRCGGMTLAGSARQRLRRRRLGRRFWRRRALG